MAFYEGWLQISETEHQQLMEKLGEKELKSRMQRLIRLKKEEKRPLRMKSDAQALYAMGTRPVEAIKDIKILESVKENLKNTSERDYFLFMLGLNSGLRISDLIALKAGDVRGKKHIEVKNPQTGVSKQFPLNKAARKMIQDYTNEMLEEEFLFTSAKTDAPIRRDRAYKVLKAGAEEAGVENFGTHTLRKTFGYHFYQQYEDAELLQKLFNHSSRSVTLRYIGISQEEIEEEHDDFSL